MATLTYTANKSNAFGASASSVDPYFSYQTYNGSIDSGTFGNYSVISIDNCSISNANTNGSSATGNYKMQIEVKLNGTWYALGYIFEADQKGAHQTFNDWHETADANTKSLMGKYAPSGIRGKVIEGYFHLNAGSNIVLNATLALDYTPSTFSFSASTVDAGSSITININRMSTNLTHTINMVFGSETASFSGVTTSKSYTIPYNWLLQIPNSQTGTCTVTVSTYAGSSLIGSNHGTFTVRAGNDVIPTLSSITVVGVDLFENLFVQGKSKATLTINGAAGTYGSTITRYSITGGGYSGTVNPFTTGVLNTAGINVFSATVTDSRGRTSTAKTVSILVTAYSAPSITSVVVERAVDSIGTLGDEGTYCKVSIAYTWSAISGNTRTTKFAYKETTAGSYGSDYSTLVESGGYIVLGSGTTFSIEKSYNIRVILDDDVSSPAYYYVTLGTSEYLADFNPNINAVCIGGVATHEDSFEIAQTKEGYYKGQTFDERFRKNTDIIPISNGGTGQTTVAAARNALGLGNTTGALPIANGGTGQTTVAAARNALGLGNTAGALPIANGGTGQTTAAAARNALGLGNTTGALPIANGGTGATTVAAAQDALGIITGSGTAYSAGTNISYGITFSAVPTVICTWSTKGGAVSGDWGTLKVYNKTTTGFTVAAGGSNPSSAQAIDWIAIGPR